MKEIMKELNKRKSIAGPAKQSKVNFFYMKPLQKQQQEVCDPELTISNLINYQFSILSLAKHTKESFKASDQKTKMDARYEKISIQSSCLQLEKIKRKYLEDYLFLSNLGKWAYGRIQKLKSNQDGIVYAGKIILKSYNAFTNAYKNKNLETEIKIYSRISHPNIPELHQIYTWKNEYSLIMQYVNGLSLHSILQSHPNDQQKIARIMYQILDALEYLHSMNFVHHDIKPQNIMYFGQAVELNSQSKTVQKCGRIFAYFVPEYFENQCSGKIDIRACGLILYYLLDENIYFYETTKQKMKQKIKTKQVQFQGYNWTCRGKQVKQLILKMLEKDPNKRMSAADAKQHVWFQQNCRSWNNQVKNSMKTSTRDSIRSQKRNRSFERQNTSKDKQAQRTVNSQILILKDTKNLNKLSRFCNNRK